MIKKILKEHTFPSINKIIDSNSIWFPADDCRHIAFNTIYSGACGEIITRNDKIFDEINFYIAKFMDMISFVIIGPSFAQPLISNTSEFYENKLIEIVKPVIQENIDNYDENNLVTWFH